MIKGIIFDYNGVFSGADWYWTLVKQKLDNFTEREEEFIALANKTDLGEITPSQFKDEVAKRLGMTREELNVFRSNIYNSNNYIRTDLITLAEQLKSKYKIAMLSNYSATTLMPILKEYNLERLFDHIGISSEIGAIKPDPKAFDYVIEKIGLSRDTVLFVDDNHNHVKAGSEIGIQSVLFTDTQNFIKYLQENNISIS